MKNEKILHSSFSFIVFPCDGGVEINLIFLFRPVNIPEGVASILICLHRSGVLDLLDKTLAQVDILEQLGIIRLANQCVPIGKGMRGFVERHTVNLCVLVNLAGAFLSCKISRLLGAFIL